jgi:predicted enzyme related to lactoylglutathione lyase
MNRVVHFEIHAKDMDKLQKFYEQLFGWKISGTGPEFGGYRMIMTGPGPDDIAAGKVTMENVGINGGMTPRSGDMPTATQTAVNAFVNIIGVEDTDAMFKKGIELGGTESMAPMDVPHVGRLAYLKDPEHNVFGILKPQM